MATSNNVLGTTETIIKNAGTGEQYVYQTIIFCNKSNANVTISVYLYPYGSGAGDNSIIIKDFTISAKDTFVWSGAEKIFLENQDILSAVCSVDDAVVVTSSYMKV